MTTRDEIIAAAREEVQNLFTNCIDVKPQMFDFTEPSSSWFSLEAVECDGCGQYIVTGDDHGFADRDGKPAPQELLDIDDEHERLFQLEAAGFGYCPRHGDWFSDFQSAEGPQMNYRYPVNVAVTYDNVRKIANLPLCLIDDRSDAYLALTGGGMDLSWEICEAYIRLGFLPPTHFDLEAMADKFLNPRTARIIAAAERACEVQQGWIRRRGERTTQLFTDLPTREDNR